MDACRYDYFERVYKDYPVLREGKLEKVYSPASHTIEWLIHTFKGRVYNDIVYISANPYVNSKGIAFSEFDPRYLRFYRIVDVWDFGWDERLGTVLPSEVNKAVIVAVKMFPNKRFIIHYIQPHYPYIDLIKRGIGPKPKKGEVWWQKTKRPLIVRVKGFIRWRIVNIFGEDLGRKIAIKLAGYPKLSRPGCVELVAKSIGIEVLRKAYESNLRSTLHYVSKLIEITFRGRIIITADHGELLGEYGLYEHPTWIDVPELREIPWLEIIR